MNPNRKRPGNAPIRPLAAIPNKEGFVLVGVRKDGSEALLTVFVDKDGFYKVDGYEHLAGWRHLP